MGSPQTQVLAGSPGSELGASALWDDRNGNLYWLDITVNGVVAVAGPSRTLRRYGGRGWGLAHM